MIAQKQTKVLSTEELEQIERGLFDRLSAPATHEQQIDLVDYSTRVLRQVLQSHKTLQTKAQS